MSESKIAETFFYHLFYSMQCSDQVNVCFLNIPLDFLFFLYLNTFPSFHVEMPILGLSQIYSGQQTDF